MSGTLPKGAAKVKPEGRSLALHWIGASPPTPTGGNDFPRTPSVMGRHVRLFIRGRVGILVFAGRKVFPGLNHAMWRTQATPFRRIPAGSDARNVSAFGRNALKISGIGNLLKCRKDNSTGGPAPGCRGIGLVGCQTRKAKLWAMGLGSLAPPRRTKRA